MFYNQVPLTTTPALILNLVDRRDVVAIVATADCYVGDVNVTAGTGLLVKAGVPEYLSPGNPAYVAAQGSLYGVTATGTSTMSYAEMANQ